MKLIHLLESKPDDGLLWIDSADLKKIRYYFYKRGEASMERLRSALKVPVITTIKRGAYVTEWVGKTKEDSFAKGSNYPRSNLKLINQYVRQAKKRDVKFEVTFFHYGRTRLTKNFFDERNLNKIIDQVKRGSHGLKIYIIRPEQQDLDIHRLHSNPTSLIPGPAKKTWIDTHPFEIHLYHEYSLDDFVEIAREII